MTAALLAMAFLTGGTYRPNVRYISLTRADAEGTFLEGLNHRHNSAAARGHFSYAAGQFDICWNTEERSSELAINRGHAHYLAGDLPHAILAYREGLALFPWDATLQHELALCRSTVAFPAESMAELRHRVSPTDLLLASAIASALLTLGLAARFTFRPSWSGPPSVIGGIGLLAVAAAAWQIDRETDRYREYPVAVVTADTLLRTGNAELYPARLPNPLPRGAELRAVLHRGGWAQVRLPDGTLGWLPDAVIATSGEDASPKRR